MSDAGWLLLLLFLGACSLVVVAIFYPSFRRARETVYHTTEEAHTFTVHETPPTQEKGTQTLSVREWLSLINDHPDDAPHTLIVGTTGSGKTTLAQAIAATRSGALAILDPKWKPGRWGGLAAVPIDDDGTYTQLEAAALSLLEELNSRLVSLKHGATTFEPVTIIAEELPTLIQECPSAAHLFKQVGRLGRELGIRLVGLSQSERVKSLGVVGEGDARDNYTLVRLGKAATAALPEVRTALRPAVLEWRGEHYQMEFGDIVRLSVLPIPPSRSWRFSTLNTNVSKQGSQQPPKQAQAEVKASELVFTPEEVGQIARMIVNGREPSTAVRSMPRYNRRRHKEYTDYYERLKAAMEASTGSTDG